MRNHGCKARIYLIELTVFPKSSFGKSTAVYPLLKAFEQLCAILRPVLTILFKFSYIVSDNPVSSCERQVYRVCCLNLKRILGAPDDIYQ